MDSLRRCLLFWLNQESWFENASVELVVPVLRFGLPPNSTLFTPLVPSANVELMRTLPLGMLRNGSDSLRDPVRPSVVSVSMPNQK